MRTVIILLRLTILVDASKRTHEAILDGAVSSLARYSCDPTVFARKISRMVVQLVRDGACRPHQVLVMPDFGSGQSLE
jgi:hypothetical protein